MRTLRLLLEYDGTDFAGWQRYFDARRAARGKVYRYRIGNHLVRSPLTRARPGTAAPRSTCTPCASSRTLFRGEHDFHGFRAADCDRLSTVRLLRRFEVDRQGALRTIEVEGTAFLKHMVRILAGTLVSVGRGDLERSWRPATAPRPA